MLALALLSAACSSDGADFPYAIGAEQPDDAADETIAPSIGAVELSEAIAAAGDVSGFMTKPWARTFCGLRPSGKAECWGAADTIFGNGSEGKFAEISGGFSGVCGLRLSGEADCWSLSGFDFLIEPHVPSGSFATISSWGFGACGLRPSGSVECWGALQTITFSGEEFTSVSVGGGHVCALRPDGEAQCWGVNSFGQTDALGGPFVAVDAGASHSCGLRSDGSVECWGEDALDAADLVSWGAEFGDDEEAYAADRPDKGTYNLSPDHRVVSFLDLEGAVPELEVRQEMARRAQGWAPPAGPFVSVSAGDGFTCGLSVDGEVDCWGYFAREEPRIPLDVYAEVYGPRLSDFYDTNKAKAAASAYDYFSPTFEPRFYSLYESLYGTRVWELDPTEHRIGGLDSVSLGTMIAPLRLVNPPPGPFIAVEAGWDNACGLRPNGEIECWGSDNAGEPLPGLFATVPVHHSMTPPTTLLYSSAVSSCRSARRKAITQLGFDTCASSETLEWSAR